MRPARRVIKFSSSLGHMLKHGMSVKESAMKRFWGFASACSETNLASLPATDDAIDITYKEIEPE